MRWPYRWILGIAKKICQCLNILKEPLWVFIVFPDPLCSVDSPPRTLCSWQPGSGGGQVSPQGLSHHSHNPTLQCLTTENVSTFQDTLFLTLLPVNWNTRRTEKDSKSKRWVLSWSSGKETALWLSPKGIYTPGPPRSFEMDERYTCLL